MYVSLLAWRHTKEERLIWQATLKLPHVTELCLKTKLQIYSEPSMAHTLCCA
jgi:hypothetical protein